MKAIALTTGKGGTGKTSMAVNLAVGLARQGKRVLLVDLDPTAHATVWLRGFDDHAKAGTAEALLEGRLREEHLRQVEVPGARGGGSLDLLPATRGLTTAELSLAPDVGAHLVLREVLTGYKGAAWDFAFFDCPPSLAFYSVAAMCAADGILAPVPAAFLALAGVRLLEERLELARRRLNARAKLLGLVLFDVDEREGITEEARQILRREAGDRLFDAEVRTSTAAKSLPARRETVWTPGADERGLSDYRAVLAEAMDRLTGGGSRQRKE